MSTMKIDGIDVPEIRQSDFYALLEDEENTLVFGNKGIGKSSIVRKFAKDKGKTLLVFPLATMIPEFIGGVPYAQVSADKKTEYFTLLLNEQLAPMFECKGKDYILFFDEINQAPTEVMNCLYGPCHIDPEQREWCGHSLEFAQIVAAGNLSDGTDGTVYLNELPGPLLDRFDVFLLVNSDKDAMDYLKKKWKNIPQVAKYIKAMQDSKINPRNMDHILKMLQFEKNPLRMRAKLGTALTQKLVDMQKGMKSIDPADLIKNVRTAYERFQEDGIVAWGPETISTEEELIEKFKEILSEEEVASIVKGGK